MFAKLEFEIESEVKEEQIDELEEELSQYIFPDGNNSKTFAFDFELENCDGDWEKVLQKNKILVHNLLDKDILYHTLLKRKFKSSPSNDLSEKIKIAKVQEKFWFEQYKIIVKDLSKF